MNTSSNEIFTASSIEFNNDVRIVLQEQPLGTVKEMVLGYNFLFLNDGKQHSKFIPIQILLDYTNEIMNGGTYATCETKIQDCLDRLYGDSKDSAPVEYFFYRFADDILEDYWDIIEKELVG